MWRIGKPEKNYTPGRYLLEEEHTSPAWLSPRRANLICNTPKRFLPKATTRDSTCIWRRSPKRQGLIENRGCWSSRSWISRYFIYIITNAKYNTDNNGKKCTYLYTIRYRFNAIIRLCKHEIQHNIKIKRKKNYTYVI